MRNRIKDIIDSWVTSAFGVAAMTISLVMIWRGTFDFVPEGIAGLGIGALLLLAPKTIERKISELIKAWGGKDEVVSEDCSHKPDNPDEN